jgi:DNA helicase-2/ATP-dependent DNA helicase PcrA
LVDEYQDTNGTQNELLFQLADYWDRPNLFVVGDDDQAIYKFQGANVTNITEFRDKYQPTEVVLTKNYRSNQPILDASKALIDNNVERLVSKIEYLSKDLEASGNDVKEGILPTIIAFQNEKQEDTYIVHKIEKLREQGVAYKDIAIIYRSHKNIDNIVRYFQFKNIPFVLKKKEDIFTFPLIKKMINILSFIGSEYIFPDQDSGKLFEIMNYNEFGLKIRDNGRISYYCYQESRKENPIKWRDVIADKDILEKIGVKQIEETLIFSKLIESWIQDIPNMTLQVLMEKIMTESKILDHAMRSADSTVNLQTLNIFFEFVKSESVRNTELNPETLLEVIQNMSENNIGLQFNRIYSSENGVNLMTAHGSKGLEFEHVFITKLTDNMWSKKKGGNFNFSIPPTLLKSTGANDIEDDRRLMYVAMTRAKNYLYLCNSSEDSDGKNLVPSQFLAEIINVEHREKQIELEENQIADYLYAQMKPVAQTANIIDSDLIARTIETIKINPTGLSKYLKCPLEFYFENILRVPMARTASMGYGNAIHHALDRYFSKIENDPQHRIMPLEDLFYFFKDGMDKFRSHFTTQEFNDLTINGRNTLANYYEEYKADWAHVRHFLSETKIDGVYDNTPITGRIDMIKVYDNKVSVIDFKTGKYNPQKLKSPSDINDDEGSDYWRQMVMYKMLLNQDPRNNYKMDEGFMDFVEPKSDGSTEKPKRFVIDDWEVEKVGKELVDTYEKITNHIFEPGCGKPDCKWCSFVGDNEMLVSPLDEEYEEEN